MGATTKQVRARRTRGRADGRLAHPIRRLFGESRGVAFGAVFIVAIVGLMLVRPLVMSFLSWHRTAALLTERRGEVQRLEHRHAYLKAQVEYFQTDAFVEEQARAYGMVKPGETPFVIRELVHPESAAEYAISRLRNATLDNPVALAAATE